MGWGSRRYHAHVHPAHLIQGTRAIRMLGDKPPWHRPRAGALGGCGFPNSKRNAIFEMPRCNCFIFGGLVRKLGLLWNIKPRMHVQPPAMPLQGIPGRCAAPGALAKSRAQLGWGSMRHHAHPAHPDTRAIRIPGDKPLWHKLCALGCAGCCRRCGRASVLRWAIPPAGGRA